MSSEKKMDASTNSNGDAKKKKSTFVVKDVVADLTPQEIENQARRVTQEDFAKITPEHMREVMQYMTKEQMSSALEAVINANRFSDVVDSMPKGVFEAALMDMRDDLISEATIKVQGNHAFQASVLGSLNESHRQKCTEHLAHSLRDGKKE
jgi:hypothetical protein